MRKFVTLLGGIALGLCSLGAQAGLAKDQLNNFYKFIRTYQAQFDQELVDAKGKVLQKATGTFYLARPDRFRWDYDAPQEQRIVADGKKVWVYDVDLEQVTVRNMDDALGTTPAHLLSSKTPINRNFTLRETGEREGLHWVELTPRIKDTTFEKMRLGFNATDLAAMELVDGMGQVTKLRFTRVVRNPGLGNTLFQFTPPKGVDVIGDK